MLKLYIHVRVSRAKFTLQDFKLDLMPRGWAVIGENHWVINALQSMCVVLKDKSEGRCGLNRCLADAKQISVTVGPHNITWCPVLQWATANKRAKDGQHGLKKSLDTRNGLFRLFRALHHSYVFWGLFEGHCKYFRLPFLNILHVSLMYQNPFQVLESLVMNWLV